MRDIRRCSSILFLHLRKAGGTSLRNLLQQVGDHHGIPLITMEGTPLSGQDFDKDTFLVANFREPLERIFSLYNAEGDYPPQSKDKYIPFHRWLQPKTKIQSRRAPPLWRHISNYHVRVFSDTGARHNSWEDIRGREISGRDYRLALLALQRVDLPLVLEKLQDSLYQRYLTDQLLGPAATPIDIPFLRRTSHEHGSDVRSLVTPQQRQYLLETNRWDLELYRFVCWQADHELGGYTRQVNQAACS